ncbi:1,4-dihydroxy-2-naphthoate octaprenyltransferase [Thioflavicoccus mobilis 8321]|uniref:1,4-dihydroxy-2-naphthoate octaprenyltransferase n=1 Tax=Thioflavicoccus mobilis 8321 TaxID=765912 RepID=L0H1B5_9GAMM|nr:1,4-dihydroxy-2-naphthoate octaprenyltransferase [Thioflavicoccus mobilis]AGA91986.1 1,4-dihydroxy-2-naphthoate octaprenyltransferase [Thioflavicoccus mobilis 8321]
MSVPAHTLGHWIAAARPKTLPLAVTPVVAGIILAVAETGHMAIVTAILTLLTAVSIQIATNLHNDVADFERGADTADRLGPPRATAQGWLSVRQVKTGAHLAFLTAFVLGLLLAWRGGLPILLLGLASLASGYAYTGGPRPIAYGPFGELFVLAFFGVAAVAGTYYLQTLTLAVTPLAVGVAVGLPSAAVLMLNNYRDLETDRRAGRRTLAHYLGPAGSRVAYAALLLGPLPILVAADLPGRDWPLLAAPLLALPLIARVHGGASGGAINALLGQTARYQMALILLLAIGLGLPTSE